MGAVPIYGKAVVFWFSLLILNLQFQIYHFPAGKTHFVPIFEQIKIPPVQEGINLIDANFFHVCNRFLKKLTGNSFVKVTQHFLVNFDQGV